MKRRGKAPNKFYKHDAKLSKLLFNKSKDLVENLKDSNTNDEIEDINRKPVWVDEDDRNFQANTLKVNSKALYVDKLKKKYETLMGTPGWSKLNKKVKPDEHEGDDTILRTVGHLEKEKRVYALRKGVLAIKGFQKINAQTGNEGPIIECVEFHPKSSVALVAGQSGIVTLFSVGGDINDKIHTFKLKKWDISTAIFAPSGNVAYISSRKIHSYCVYDLIKAEPKLVELPPNMKKPMDFKLSPDGKYIGTCDGFDEVFIICAESKELLKCLKHSSKVKTLTFSHDSKQLYSYGEQGEITIWDLSTYKSMKKFYDHGCVTASRIATSPCGRLLATGSGEGIVNIYQTPNLTGEYPLPYKTISHLTTKITNIKFNPTTEILSIASSLLPDAMKLVHIPSYHVFMNFPLHNATMFNVNTVSFSPNSGYMAFGNDQRSAYMFRLNYYRNY